MGEYRVSFARAADRDYQNLPRSVQERAGSAIDALAKNPRPRGIKKLRVAADLWRFRVGDYRVIYRIDDGQRLVDVTHIRHRRDAYE